MPLARLKTAQLKQNIPDFSTGDTVRVHQRITEVNTKGEEKQRIQIFEGLVIARKGGSGPDAMFTVRKISSGVGVERIYPLHSPAVAKIEVVKAGAVRQSKIYYVRDRLGNQPRYKKSPSKRK